MGKPPSDLAGSVLEPRIAAVEALERSARTWGEAEIDYPFPQFRPRAGTVAEKVRFANLGYAEDAVASYERFASAVERGAVRVAFGSR